MFKLLFILSAINLFKIAFATDVKNCSCESANESVSAFIYDDAPLRQMTSQMDLLTLSNENLRLRLDTLSTRLEQQTDLLTEVNKKLEGSEGNDRVIFSTRPLIDVRSTFTADDASKVDNKTCAAVRKVPGSCAEATAITRKSGLHAIQVTNFSEKPFLVACDEAAQGGGWTVIQRRVDGSIDFQRNWTDFQTGFGNLEGEFFIGLEKLHAMTAESVQELLIVMEDFDNAKKYAKYDSFAIGNENEGYALNVLGSYSGDAGDSLRPHVSHKFTTKDVDNDTYDANCAVLYTGAWWHYKCHVSNLNGQYLRGVYPQEQFAKGIVWHTFRGYNYALKFVQMMIRPQRN